MYSGSRSRSQPRSSAAPVSGERSDTYVASRASPGACSQATTAACRTSGCRASAASTSPGSMRKPRTLTCRSIRPTNSSVPSGSQRTRSPVRYSRAPGSAANGSGT